MYSVFVHNLFSHLDIVNVLLLQSSGPSAIILSDKDYEILKKALK